MSKYALREEKICLNCGAEVQHRFCPACGQQNIEPDLSVSGLIHDFIHDLTHFDGKFFSTSKFLIFKPGFLSTEFICGRRSRYLHPVRLYVFTSAIFFYLFFNFFVDTSEIEKSESKSLSPAQLVEKLNEIDTSNKNVFRLEKSYLIRSKNDTIFDLSQAGVIAKLTDSISIIESQNAASSLSISFSEKQNDVNAKFKNVESYLHFQDSIPNVQRDGFFKKYMLIRGLKIKLFFEENKKKAIWMLLDKFIHSFPTLLFISLPLLALVLQLLFFRRKKMGYAVHGIFLLHLYVFTFLALLFYFTVVKIFSFTPLDVPGLFAPFILLGVIFYGYKAFRNFYILKRAKTIVYYSIFLLFSFLSISFLFIFYFLFMLLKL
jgi:hypothetical protein